MPRTAAPRSRHVAGVLATLALVAASAAPATASAACPPGPAASNVTKPATKHAARVAREAVRDTAPGGEQVAGGIAGRKIG